MDPELFRHLVPGLIFWLPTLVVLMLGFEIPRDEGLTWATIVFASTPPVGWLLYQNFRVLWLGWPTYGYERSPFVEMIRSRLRVHLAPTEREVIVNFSELSKELGVRRFTWAEFMTLFHWRSSARLFRFPWTLGRAQTERALTRRSTLSLEPLADLLLFDDPGMEYARTISTVRYAYMTAAFALMNGLIVAAGILFILGPMRHGHSPFMEATHAALALIRNGQALPLQKIGLVLLLGWALSGLILAIKRFRLATAEYFARTALITVRRSQLNACDLDFLASNQDAACKAALDQIILSGRSAPLALFDLDDTLIDGDIGEAVFALMLKKGLFGPEPRLTYQAYQILKNEDEGGAYREVVRAMNGCLVSDIKACTTEVLESTDAHIEIEGIKVTVPKRDERFYRLLTLLWLKGFRCLVVTASNKWSADVVCWSWFGVASIDVIGVQTEVRRTLSGSKATDVILEPAPIGRAKRQAVMKAHPNIEADLAAGNSPQDDALFGMVRPGGAVLLVGGTKQQLAATRAALQTGARVTELSKMPQSL